MVDIFDDVSIDVQAPLFSPDVSYSSADIDVFVVPVKGEPGAAGAPGGLGFNYSQSTPSSSWVIEHNLGRFVNPVVRLDSDPETPVWTDVTLIDENHTTLMFPQPETGWAHF